MSFPTFETERLLLRPISKEDIDFVYQHFSDNKVTQYLYDEPPLMNREEAVGLIDFFVNSEAKTYNRWIIFRKVDHQPIGTCGFHKWEKRYFRAEIGYDLAAPYWGQGYMKEALKSLSKMASPK